MKRRHRWTATKHLILRIAPVLAMTTGHIRAEPPILEKNIESAAQQAVGRGLSYLSAVQGSEGAWRAFDQPHPAITALAVKCFVQDEQYGPDHSIARRGLDYILRHVQPDGGIYVPAEGMRNYHTSVALMALAATGNPAHEKVIHGAQGFLKKLQWDEGEGHERSSPWYGGVGYGREKRPDLSNTQLMIEALKQSGLSADDPVYRKALTFVARCQMLGHSNDQPFATESVDGGFIYSPANGGESKAGIEMVNGKPQLRSYGSMTYAGFKSLLYANVDRDDARVQRAAAWISRHYTLRHNPNMPLARSRQGLYYYYHVFARAMDAWGQEMVKDSAGVDHPWREELCRMLVSLQRDDGSWVNDADRWYEGNPQLVTAYALLALQTALSGPQEGVSLKPALETDR